jgi:riboflavin-specific deaminase-like protein
VNSKLKIKSPKLPFVFSNFAMTADGKIAFSKTNFVPFSSARDREHILELRATADAVMCGARTIETTRTILGTGGIKFRKLRLRRGLAEFPLRIIVSGNSSIDPRAEIFKKHFSPILILTTADIPENKLRRLGEIADEVKTFGEREIDFRAAFRWLREKWSVKRLLCEGGGELHGALIRANLVDELHLTICPKIFGGRITPTIADGEGFAFLAGAAKFRLKSAQSVKGELFTVFQRR